MDWNEMMEAEMPTKENEALEAQYAADMDRAQFMARINELLAGLSAERAISQRFEAQLEAATAAEVDAVRRAQEAEAELAASESLLGKHLKFAEKVLAERNEAKRQHAVTLERIANLALEAALTDGAHHKQWYLERIMAECGAPVQRWHKAHGWEVGIAP